MCGQLRRGKGKCMHPHMYARFNTHTHRARILTVMPTSHSLVGMVMLVFLMPRDQLKEVLLFF